MYLVEQSCKLHWHGGPAYTCLLLTGQIRGIDCCNLVLASFTCSWMLRRQFSFRRVQPVISRQV